MTDMRPFLAACQHTLDADADILAAIAADGYGPEYSAWLLAHTTDLSPDPQDWDPEYRELMRMVVRQFMRRQD